MRRSVVTIVGDMDGSDSLPNDLGECQRLLLSAFQQATDLERRVAESEHQVAELNRVLSETSASYELLQQEHAATLDELAWYKRWAFGRRRERFEEGEGQGHLFALEANMPANDDVAEPTSSAMASTCKAIAVAVRNARSTGTGYRRSATSMTCRRKRRFAPAVAARWTASARMSRENWN